MRCPIHIHVAWLSVVGAVLALGASGSRECTDRQPDVAAAGEIAALRSEVDQLRAALADVDEKVKFITIEPGNINGVAGPHMLVTGCNVHIRSGGEKTDDGVAEGSSESTNLGKYKGLGNLIIGYNEGFSGLDDRQGSHNLVIGIAHKFPSVGGLVAGAHNAASGRYASVSGGQLCTASGKASSVAGGAENVASGPYSSIGGGVKNKASAECASVGGGSDNTASGTHASVSGGQLNEASGTLSSVSGGLLNKALNSYASVSGGRNNNASGEAASISGGKTNTATGKHASISGGKDQTNATDL